MLRKVVIGVSVILAVFLVSSLASAGMTEEPAKDIRTVTVKVAADQEYRDFYGTDWQNQTKSLIEKVSQVFEREFGIKFEVREFKEWDSEIHENISEFAEELRKEIELGDNDLVIGFTGKGNRGASLGYVRRLLGNYLVIEDLQAAIQWWKKYYQAHKESYRIQGWGEERWKKFIENFVEQLKETNLSWVLASRLGAIFGAFNISSKDIVSVMNYDLQRRIRLTLEFDEENKKIFELIKI